MPPPSLTDVEITRRLRVLTEHGGSLRAAALALGITRPTLSHTIDQAKKRGIAPPAEAEVAPEHSPATDRELQRLRDRNKRLEAQLAEIRRDSVEAEDVRKVIFGLSATTPEPPDWLVTTGAAGGVTGVPSLIASDWHLGEVVNPAEVNGVNAYDLTIAEARIRRLVERSSDLCLHHMVNPRYPGIVVNLLGDIVSGEIHDELAQTNELELFPIVLWARDRIVWMLRQLADRFGQVFVVCAPGNHGRTTRKPQAKRYAAKNADWLLYCLIEKVFADVGDGRVRFSIPETGEVLYRIYGHRYMALHGDDLGVKGGDGIIGAIGPIMRGEIKMRNSSAQIDRDYDTLLIGHYHQTLWLPRAIVNNTLKGYDEYSRRMLRAPASPPSQALWFTHPVRGITARWDVGLDDRPIRAGADWVSWPATSAA